MALISENLQTLIECKAAMKEALIYKQSEPTGGLTTYADAIMAITNSEQHSCRIEYPENVDIIVLLDGVDVTDTYTSNGLAVIDELSNDIVIKVVERLHINYNLTNVVSSNQNLNIGKNREFRTILSCSEGHYIHDVVVSMGGIDITDVVFNADTNEIVIENVTSDISINAISSLKMFNITNQMSNTVNSNRNNTINYGEAYTATITANEGYILGDVVVSMGDNEIEVINGIINIPNVIDNIIITANATLKQFNVVSTITNGSIDNNEQSVYYGSRYVANITSDEGYDISSVTVTMGGNDVTDSVYANGVIMIDSVVGDINIMVVMVESTVAVIGQVNESNTIEINDNALSRGTYKLVYEDVNNNELDSMNQITTFNI